MIFTICCVVAFCFHFLCLKSDGCYAATIRCGAIGVALTNRNSKSTQTLEEGVKMEETCQQQKILNLSLLSKY